MNHLYFNFQRKFTNNSVNILFKVIILQILLSTSQIISEVFILAFVINISTAWDKIRFLFQGNVQQTHFRGNISLFYISENIWHLYWSYLLLKAIHIFQISVLWNAFTFPVLKIWSSYLYCWVWLWSAWLVIYLEAVCQDVCNQICCQRWKSTIPSSWEFKESGRYDEKTLGW